MGVLALIVGVGGAVALVWLLVTGLSGWLQALAIIGLVVVVLVTVFGVAGVRAAIRPNEEPGHGTEFYDIPTGL